MTPSALHASGTTEDAFLGGRLVIEQPAKGYRAGLDAVLLAACVPPGRQNCLRVLDVGAGVGTAGLCVARRLSAAHVTLFEREPSLAGLARSNALRNGLEDRVCLIEGSVLAKAAEQEAAGLHPASFDVVICNPPYLSEGRSSLPEGSAAASSFGMPVENLERWVRFMARMAAPRGEMLMIHRVDALGVILAAIGARFGDLMIMPLHPRAGEPAHRIIVSGIKGSRAPLQLLAGLVLHGDGNAFVPRVDSILRNGEGFALR